MIYRPYIGNFDRVYEPLEVAQGSTQHFHVIIGVAQVSTKHFHVIIRVYMANPDYIKKNDRHRAK